MTPLIITHAAFAGAAVFVGVAVLGRRKGTPSHKLLGRVWVACMAAVALSSFWIFEIRRGAGPSWIHVLSIWTLISMKTMKNQKYYSKNLPSIFLSIRVDSRVLLRPIAVCYRISIFSLKR